MKDQDVKLTFERELATLLNRYSRENESNTPDFILAQYIEACLAAFTTGVQQRETWYGRDARPSFPGTIVVRGDLDAPLASAEVGKIALHPRPPRPVDDGELALMLADRLGARVLAMVFSRVRVRRGPENLEIWIDCVFDSWWSTPAEVEARVTKLLRLDELEMLAARDLLGAVFCWPRSRRWLKEAPR